MDSTTAYQDGLKNELAALQERCYRKDGLLKSNARPQDVERIETLRSLLKEKTLTPLTDEQAETLGIDPDRTAATGGIAPPAATEVVMPDGEVRAVEPITPAALSAALTGAAEEPAMPGRLDELAGVVARLAEEVARQAEEIELLKAVLHRSGILRHRKFVNQLKRSGPKVFNKRPEKQG
jgi:hypothetical protein